MAGGQINIRYGLGLVGDYGGDGVLGVGDLDLQAVAIDSGMHPQEYDLTGDNQVNYQDRLHWVKELTSLPHSSTVAMSKAP